MTSDTSLFLAPRQPRRAATRLSLSVDRQRVSLALMVIVRFYKIDYLCVCSAESGRRASFDGGGTLAIEWRHLPEKKSSASVILSMV